MVAKRTPTPETSVISLKITRTFDAPRELVWQVWTQHDHLMQWFCPEQFVVLYYESDLTVGGGWRSAMRAPDENEYIAGGRFKIIEEPHTLAFTHTWVENNIEPLARTLVTVTLRENEAGTEMVFEQVGFATDESRDSHRGGWNGAFENLATRLVDVSGNAASLIDHP